MAASRCLMRNAVRSITSYCAQRCHTQRIIGLQTVHKHILLQGSPQVLNSCMFARYMSQREHAEEKTRKLKAKNDDIIVDKSSYSEAYKFNHILFARAISVMKIYQTGLTLCACPLLGYIWKMGMISDADLLFGAGVAAMATAMLFVMSRFIQRIAGIVYLHKDEEKVLISHLTFWGNRRDIILDVSNIVPITDENQNILDVYVRINTFDRSETFFLFLKYGIVINKEAIHKVFGDIKPTK